MNKEIEILLELKDIPIGSKVRKPTGDKEYILKDKVQIYGDAELRKELKADDGVLFLVESYGGINAISSSKKMVWKTNIHYLYNYLNELIECEEDE